MVEIRINTRDERGKKQRLDRRTAKALAAAMTAVHAKVSAEQRAARRKPRTTWRPLNRRDLEYLISAYDELINAAELHEDADPSDRGGMHNAMLYIADRLDRAADRVMKKEMGR